MGSYHGPKARVNRRLNQMVFESAGAIRAYERRNAPPGMHNRRGKQSEYGLALAEKQKIKYYYGLRERQLRRYFDLANRRGGNTGAELLLICERRIDNVIRRAGLCKTRPQARQGVTHRHFLLNGRALQTPSLLVRPGDVIEVRHRTNTQNLYKGVTDEMRPEGLSWLNVDVANLRVTVLGFPSVDDISLPVEIQRVIEFMSR